MTQLKGTANQGLGGATLGFFIGFAAVSLYGPTAALIKEQIQLSPLLIGLLVAAPNLSGSLLRIPFSAWVDTTGGRKPMLILLILSILGMAGLSYLLSTSATQLNGHYIELLVYGVLSGCGIATFSVGISQTSYWFPMQRQGSALATYAGIGNLAPGIFAFLIPLVALPILGLSGAYIAWLIFLTIGTICYFFLAKNAWYFQARQQGDSKQEAIKKAKAMGQEIFPKGRLIDSLKTSAAKKATWILVAIYFTTFGGFLALTGWLPNYFVSYFGLPIKVAGGLTATYAILASLVRIYGGTLADKFGGKTTLYYSLSILLVGSFMVTISSAIIGAVAGVILMGIGMGVGNAAVFKLVPKAAPDAIGGVAGWVGGLGAFGGFIIPLALALFLTEGVDQDHGYGTGFALFMILALLSMAATRIFNETNFPPAE